MFPLLLLMVAGAHAGTLRGYVFRETDGNPPRRSMAVELCEGERSRYHTATGPDGKFLFQKVQYGSYSLRVRFGEFIAAAEQVTIAGNGENFAAVMLPKRRAKAQDFRSVSADQLASQSDRRLRKEFREAARLVARQELAGAARIYEKAAAAHGTTELWDRLGILYQQMGRNGDSARAFEKAIALDVEYLLPYAHLGWLYMQERKYGDLLGLARRAVTIDPEWMTAHTMMAEARAGTGDTGAALTSLERASDLVQRKAAGPFLLMAQVRYVRRDCEGAQNNLDHYFELSTSAREQAATAELLELVRGCRPAADRRIQPEQHASAVPAANDNQPGIR
jgi:tetratricopeptide (TPR) repeat protein